MAMNSYYENTLYPLQDKILTILKSQKTQFYLTGGTALSRFYYNHRYSDDLDFFVNSYENFVKEVERIIRNLQSFGLEITQRSNSYYSIFIGKKLRVDFVNDTGTYPKDFLSTPLYSRVDKPLRILANKITSIVGRDEAKDVVDIWIIAKKTKVNWKDIFTDASSRAVGTFPPSVAQRLIEFPSDLLRNIKWTQREKPNLANFQNDLKKIAENILETS